MNIYNVVEAVILAMSVVLLSWTTSKVIAQGEKLSAHSTMLDINAGRLSDLELRGSRSLESFEKRTDAITVDLSKRVDKLEQAVIILQTTPTRLDSVQASLTRIERILEEHMKEKKL